jgi:DNA-binding GntR family transcriptional regulator
MNKSSPSEPTKTRKNKTLTDQIMAHLRDAIHSGNFNSDQEIDLSKLARDLSTSRTPVRESIRQLITEGLLELLPSGAVRVIPLPAEEVEIFYQALCQLEIATARIAAANITDVELEMLNANLSLFLKARSQPDKLSQIDSQFHNIIYNASNNDYLLQTLKPLRTRMGLLKVQAFDTPARINASYKEHVAILEALKSHDPDLTEKAIAKHITNACMHRQSFL